MAKSKENYFIIETYDEEKKMRIQFHYWTPAGIFIPVQNLKMEQPQEKVESVKKNI